MKLYSLPAAFANLEILTDDNGEIAPESLEALATLEMALEDKVDACCRVMRSYEARAAAFKEEAERLHVHQTRAEANAKRLKEYVKGVLDQLGMKKVETPLFSVRVQANPPTVKLDDNYDAADLPEEFKRIKIEVNKTAILEVAKAGGTLPPGVEVVRGSHLRVS